MHKIKNLNIHFNNFKKKSALILVTTAVIGASIVAGVVYNFKDTKYHYGQYNGSSEPIEMVDRIVYEGYIPQHTVETTFTYHASNEYKFRIFKGQSERTHYRVEIKGTEPLECSEWIKIPDDGLISINRSDFSDNQYGREFIIRYGIYDPDKNEVIVNDSYENEHYEYHVVFSSKCSKEDIEKREKFYNKLLEGVKKIIKQDDTEFDKVKKTYDYIIKHVAYDFSDMRIDYEFKDRDYMNFIGTFYTDCTGYAEILNYIFANIGIESFSSMDESNGHIWNIVKIGGKYYHLDATYSDTGSWDETSKYRYFLVSDDFMLAENHWFIKEKDVICDEMYDLTDYGIREKDVKYRGFN